MIGWLKGKVRDMEPMKLLVDVNQVGYEVYVPLSLQEKIKKGDIVEMYVFTYVKEDQITLYGFSDRSERELFLQLLKIQGIGPRSALSVLSHLTRKRLMQAILREETRVLSKIPGIGKKTSQRLITELKSWAKQFAPSIAQETSSPHTISLKYDENEVETLYEALKKLGYKRKDIEKDVEAVLKELPEGTATEWLNQVLKKRGQRI